MGQFWCPCMNLLPYGTGPCSAMTPPLLLLLGMPRCRVRFEETLRINLGLHMNLMDSLFLLNLTFLLNSRPSSGTQPRACKVLGVLTHYCLL